MAIPPTRCLIAAAATIALSVSTSTASFAFEAKLDTFTIKKNGSEVIVDTFSDGAPPPSAIGELASYLYAHGSLSENSALDGSGRLTLGSTNGPIESYADGTRVRSSGATFASNIGSNLTLGLRSSNNFAVSGLFDTIGSMGIGDGYGIRLTDRDALGQLGIGTSGNDVLELRIFRDSSNSSRIQLLKQNYLTHTVSLLSNNPLAPSHAQIELTLVNEGTQGVVARYRYGDSNTIITLNSGTHTPLFSDESFTRAEFFAIQTAPVPEPETYMMLLAGAGLIGWQLRRKSRRVASLRLA